MNRDTLKRFKLRDQLSEDHLKLFSLIEKSILAYLLIGLVFIFLEKTGLTEVYLGSSVIGGTIGYLIIAIKLMYHDEALSELKTHTNINQNTLKNAMLAIGYSEKKDGVYYPKKRMFSIFYLCKSELITHTSKNETTTFTGPHNKLLKLTKIIE
ncbi:hypothetical protein [Pseudomonas sp. GL-RE-26]|uniref:hypothetical protein n=1 Tax=Pseudomonas sp. GL-RE-26 TaxID=2832390 RepID=UPI001CBC94D6|nr:hypothetical protein [Pseudomonas sp. GL-RE-26]